VSEFKFNPNAVEPQAPVQVDGVVVTPKPRLSHSERITNARAVAIQHDRASNADPTYGGLHHPAFFIDSNGHGSPWLARHILFMAQLINTPAGLIDGKYLRDSQSFDPNTGVFESASSPLSLVDLIAAFKLQIRELGLSQAMLEEWLATIHSREEDQAFYALDFAGRMDGFKESKA
jgi:hypothetical protein